MRRRIITGKRVYVRRPGPQPALWVGLILVAALVAFVFLAKPAISRLVVAANSTAPDPAAETAVSAERVTRDIAFDALKLYVVELARTADPADARIEAARYVSRGAAGFVLPVDGMYAVLGAGFDTRAEADQVALRLRESETIDAAVHAFAADSALMRVTATEAQLTALTQAETALRQITDALRDQAMSLDRGEIEPVAVRARLSVAGSNALSARDRLSRAAGAQPNAVASSLIARLATLAGTCARLAADHQDTQLTFSSRLKYAFLDERISQIDFLKSLAP